MKKIVLLNPQWQGGADVITYKAAEEIEKLYLHNIQLHRVPVSSDTDMTTSVRNILGYQDIWTQTQTAIGILEKSNADKVFTIGGGCDADVASIYYMNEKYQGDLQVLWFDAHGDINTPAESDTKLFYGMPVRTLLGESEDAFSDLIINPLYPEQIINIGGRALDSSEERYLEENKISVISVMDNDCLYADIKSNIQKSGKNHIYIHLDLDVLDPVEFPDTPVPEKNGMMLETLHKILNKLRLECNVVGYGLFEYMPTGFKNFELQKMIDLGLEM